ncbi:MAG: Hsp20/alpha crystallin family protein [bacterium]
MFFKKTDIDILANIDDIADLEVMPSSEPLGNQGRSYEWNGHKAEGQLAVDVAQTDDELIIVATMAGTDPSNINLHLHNDLLTIRGERISPIPHDSEYFHEESYWGRFSRTIILPVDVRAELTKAEYKKGVLIIRLPKRNADNKIPIMVIDE